LTANRNTALYAQGAGLGASKGKDITEVAGLDYAALTKASVSAASLVTRCSTHDAEL
jgi:hypothetical protein